jgi:hypothetical protein
VDTSRLEKGVNAPLTSHVLGIHGIRASKFNPWTCEVLSSENARRIINIASRGFMKERCQDLMLQLMKWRVVRSEKRKSIVADFRISGFQRRRARELDASTCEVMSSEKCQREVLKESGPSIKGNAW